MAIDRVTLRKSLRPCRTDIVRTKRLEHACAAEAAVERQENRGQRQRRKKQMVRDVQIAPPGRRIQQRHVGHARNGKQRQHQ